jgi:hypothetical protein
MKIFITGAALLLHMLAVNVAWATTPSAACVAPLSSGAPDPQPRDVHITVGTDSILWTLCIVSDSPTAYAVIAAYVSIFTPQGNYIGESSNSYTNVDPVIDNTSGKPKYIITISSNPKIQPSDLKGGLLPEVLVRVAGNLCGDTAKPCAQGASFNKIYLRSWTP